MGLSLLTIYSWITFYSILSVIIAFKIIVFMTDRIGNIVSDENFLRKIPDV